MVEKAERVNNLIREILCLNEEIEKELEELDGIDASDSDYYVNDDEYSPTAFMEKIEVVAYDVDALRDLEDSRIS